MATINFDEVPSDISLSEDRVTQLSLRATEITETLKRKLEKLMAVKAAARDRAAKTADELVKNVDSRNRAAAKAIAKQTAARDAANIHRELIASSETERGDLLKALKALTDEAAAIHALCRTPAMMLGRIALGEQKRTHCIQQLEGGGPVELETAARQSIMTGDLVLAAAVSTVVDRKRPASDRPFSVAAFAERVIGETWARSHAKLEAVSHALKWAIAANREFERGKADPYTSLSLALSQRAIDATIPQEA